MDAHWPQMIVAPVDFSGAGDNPLVAARPSNSITLVKLLLVVGAATDLTFKRGTTEVSGPFPFQANGSMVLDYDPVGWYWAEAGEAINLNSSNAVQVSGTAYYVVGK